MDRKVVPLHKPAANEPCPMCGRKGGHDVSPKVQAWTMARVGWFGITGGVLLIQLIGSAWMLYVPPDSAGDFAGRTLNLTMLCAASIVFLMGLFGRLKVNARPPGQHVYHHFDDQQIRHRERF